MDTATLQRPGLVTRRAIALYNPSMLTFAEVNEAFRYDGTNADLIIEWASGVSDTAVRDMGDHLLVHYANSGGDLIAKPGDFVTFHGGLNTRGGAFNHFGVTPKHRAQYDLQRSGVLPLHHRLVRTEGDVR